MAVLAELVIIKRNEFRLRSGYQTNIAGFKTVVNLSRSTLVVVNMIHFLLNIFPSRLTRKEFFVNLFYVLRSIGVTLLTFIIWIGYSYLCDKASEKYKWFDNWGPLSFPWIVGGLLGLNIWIGTELSSALFLVFIGIASIWALATTRLR